MDSTQLERTALETKDRDELTTIATALGGKPGSRSRKAEIVDLILAWPVSKALPALDRPTGPPR
jgi:hypothetical protein